MPKTDNMKKRIFRYIKHIVLTSLVLGAIGILFGLYHGAFTKGTWRI